MNEYLIMTNFLSTDKNATQIQTKKNLNKMLINRKEKSLLNASNVH